MTIQLFAWVLMNGLIVAATWGGIALWNRQKRAERQQERLEDEITNRQAALDLVNQRVALLEERLDFSERMLKTPRQPDAQPDTPRRSPGPSGSAADSLGLSDQDDSAPARMCPGPRFARGGCRMRIRLAVG